MNDDYNRIVCSAGCKRIVQDKGNVLKAASDAGWECLQITGRWRCPTCTNELLAARDFPGVKEEYQGDQP